VGDTTQGPGRLEVVGEFVNTRDFDDDVDRLATPGDLADWLTGHGLAAPGLRAEPADLRRAVELREALRAALLANNDGQPVDGDTLAVLNRTARRGRLVVRFGPGGGAALEPVASDVDGALARLLAIVHDATETGAWARLKVCRSDTCRWAFYDQSKNRSRHWCSMDVCGSQAKARSYRRRRASEPKAGQT
jgi:predicted RNA-binding Zn ribbon-like protein